MKTRKLVLRNLWYFRKSYLAVLAGAIISTAVMTGALVVGDSVKFSLQKLTDRRLGKTRFVLQTRNRYVREELAGDLSEKLDRPVVPLLQSEGIAINSDKNRRLSRVEVIGTDDRFLQLWENTPGCPAEDEAIISKNVAEKLGLHEGDDFLLRIVKHGKIPQNAPFSSERSLSVALRFKIKGIADDDGMGRFSLENIQSAPFNIFISLHQMAKMLELEGMVNMILVPGKGKEELNPEMLDKLLRQVWQISDAGLNIRKLKEPGNLEITSSRIFFDSITAVAIKTSVKNAKEVFTYLANGISTTHHSTPYSFITAGNDHFLGNSLSDREIIINEWLAGDLRIKPGDTVQLRYFLMGPLRSMKEDSSWFRVRTVIPMNDPLSDPLLMPGFPGMSDAGNCRDWETGSPLDLKKIRDKDEQYWRDYRGTPKAFISLKTGQKLWDNKFGRCTAFRFSADENELGSTEQEIMRKIKPSELGLIFIPIYEEGKAAAAQSTDFSGLFLSLSFFIIFSGLLLMSMLFSLHARSRIDESAIMVAVGFRRKKVIRNMFYETAIISIVAAIIGALTGILYNYLILYGLNTLWQDAVRTSVLEMHIDFRTLAAGALLGMTTSMVVLILVLLRNLKNPVSILLKGKGESPVIPSLRNSLIKGIIGIVTLTGALGIILVLIVTAHFENTSLFLISGALFLVSAIIFFSLIQGSVSRKKGEGLPGMLSLVLRNLSRNRDRMLGAVALMALGTFTIIITGAYRRTFYGTENDRGSGTGGFIFWAESTMPVSYDLNTPFGKKELGIENEPIFQDVRFIQFTRVEGDDASCLNLNRVSKPVLLGIDNHFFDSVSSFSFVKLDPAVDKSHPWTILDHALSGNVIPGYADQTVIQWGLKKSVGDTLVYIDESGKLLKVRLMGGLDNSIFQGNILVSGSLLRNYYPSAGSSKTMLVDGNFANRHKISPELESAFKDYGMVITPASERLALFNSVQNTYLTVFMLLGGLGVIIGTFGLGFFILRNILGRQSELATYIALGFSRRYIFRILTTEFLIILLYGILTGLISAFAAILPSLLSPAFQLPGGFIFLILLMVFLSGFLWIIIPVRVAVSQPILEILRKE